MQNANNMAAATTQTGWKHPVNLSEAGRIATLLGGGALAIAGLRRRSAPGMALAFLGGGLMYSAAAQTMRAHRDKAAHLPYQGGIVIERSVLIEKPAAELYAFWRNFENLPCFMEHLLSVTKINEETSRWIARGPAGMHVQWDARIINEAPDQFIAWRSLESTNIDNAGSVHFEPIADGSTTIVRVVLRYDAPGKQLGAAVARLFGEEPGQQVEEDLKRFKQIMETGEVALGHRDPAKSVRHEARDIEWPSGMNPVKDQVREASEDSFPASDPPATW